MGQITINGGAYNRQNLMKKDKDYLVDQCLGLKKRIDILEQRLEAGQHETIVSLPGSITDIRLRQYEQQENPFNGTEQKLKWLCELSDTCVLEGDWNMRATGYGDTQREAFNEALQKWEEAS